MTIYVFLGVPFFVNRVNINSSFDEKDLEADSLGVTDYAVFVLCSMYIEICIFIITRSVSLWLLCFKLNWVASATVLARTPLKKEISVQLNEFKKNNNIKTSQIEIYS